MLNGDANEMQTDEKKTNQIRYTNNCNLIIITVIIIIKKKNNIPGLRKGN